MGGLLNIQSYWKNESSDPPEGDCNKAIVAGAYVTSTNSINTPSEMSNIGYLLTFGENKAYRRLLQIYFNPEATKVGIRMAGLGASPITEITVQWRYINIVS